MDFTFTDEQHQLRHAVRSYLAQHYPDAPGRPGFDDRGHDIRWQLIAQTLGLTALAAPHDCGGIGGDPVDIMIVMEEFGGALVVEPFIETVVIAGQLLARSRRPAALAGLTRIGDGLDRYALAHSRPVDGDGASLIAHRSGDSWRLNGVASTVLAAPWADRILISAQDDNSPGGLLFLVEAGATGFAMRSYATVDGRCAADVKLDDVLVPDSAIVLDGAEALDGIEATLDAARAAQCAEAVGIMRRMLRDTINHTRGRRQFGKALSEFQVLRHRMTDMAIQIECATSSVYLGTLKLSADRYERARAISTMSVIVNRALRFVWQNAIQLHGGMGMTDELAVGHFAKRAIAIEQTFGNADWHLQRFAALRYAA